MSCYACGKESHQSCPRCSNYYCNDHGKETCARCSRLPSILPFVSAFRGTLLVLLVGGALAIWLIVRPPGLPSDTSSVVEPLSPQEPELGSSTLTQVEAPTETIAFPLPSPTPTVVATSAPTLVSTPTPTPTPMPPTITPTPSPTSTEYTVQADDTLGQIADSFGTTVSAIVAFNEFASGNVTLQIGQTILIPPIEPITTTTPLTPTPSPTSTEYTVQAGDTLGQIADSFGTTVTAIVAFNEFASGNVTLQIGQTILIPPIEPITTTTPLTPTPSPTSTEYTVQAGDTLGQIATAFGTTVTAIVAFNEFASENVTLQIGQTILIPPIEPQ